MMSGSERQNWRRTRANWDTRKRVLEGWVAGETVEETASFFVAHPEEYPKGPLHRHTVGKIRKEILDLPVVLVQELVNESPEMQAFLKEKRPDLAEQIDQRTSRQTEHFTELSIAALTIASNLEKIRNAPSDSLGDPFGQTAYAVGEKVYGGWWVYEDRAKLGEVDRNVAANLLSHLKGDGEFPELDLTDDWSELVDTQITENFIQRLVHRAHRGGLGGSCKVCEDW